MRWIAKHQPYHLPSMVDLARAAVVERPDNEAIWLALGNALNESGAFEEADAHLQQSIERFPASVALRICHARTLSRLNDYERMAKTAEAAVALAPDDQSARMTRYKALRKLGKAKKGK